MTDRKTIRKRLKISDFVEQPSLNKLLEWKIRLKKLTINDPTIRRELKVLLGVKSLVGKLNGSRPFKENEIAIVEEFLKKYENSK